jgi:branched-chain amino acid transport system substrate-binding protein
MKPQRSIAGVISALWAALAIALWAGATAAQTNPAPAQISDGVVKVGLILDLSGPYSELTGQGSLVAAQMAVEDFGGKVLGFPIVVVSADHQNSSDRAAAIARDWFDNQVDAILEVSGSSEALIVQAIANTRNKIAILNAAGAERLTNQGCTATAIHYTNDSYATAHTLGRALVAGGADSWFFITVDYSYGYDLEREMTSVVTANGGSVLGRARHPLDAADFSSYLLQAQQSRAKAVGLANGGDDTSNTIKQAAALHMIPGPQTFAGLSLRINGVNNLGLPTTQGMVLTESFYWDQDDASRAWAKRFFTRVGKMPNTLQAGVYSSTLHYLQAIATAGTDATEPVLQAMRAAPVNDFVYPNGHIRADGVMIHDLYLFRVKTPAESKYPWDYYQRVTTVPGDAAFQPLAQSKCPLINK